ALRQRLSTAHSARFARASRSRVSWMDRWRNRCAWYFRQNKAKRSFTYFVAILERGLLAHGSAHSGPRPFGCFSRGDQRRLHGLANGGLPLSISKMRRDHTHSRFCHRRRISLTYAGVAVDLAPTIST